MNAVEDVRSGETGVASILGISEVDDGRGSISYEFGVRERSPCCQQRQSRKRYETAKHNWEREEALVR